MSEANTVPNPPATTRIQRFWNWGKESYPENSPLFQWAMRLVVWRVKAGRSPSHAVAWSWPGRLEYSRENYPAADEYPHLDLWMRQVIGQTVIEVLAASPNVRNIKALIAAATSFAQGQVESDAVALSRSSGRFYEAQFRLLGPGQAETNDIAATQLYLKTMVGCLNQKVELRWGDLELRSILERNSERYAHWITADGAYPALGLDANLELSYEKRHSKLVRDAVRRVESATLTSLEEKFRYDSRWSWAIWQWPVFLALFLTVVASPVGATILDIMGYHPPSNMTGFGITALFMGGAAGSGLLVGAVISLVVRFLSCYLPLAKEWGKQSQEFCDTYQSWSRHLRNSSEEGNPIVHERSYYERDAGPMTVPKRWEALARTYLLYFHADLLPVMSVGKIHLLEDDAKKLVETTAVNRVKKLIQGDERIAVGLVGPRGSGKTSALFKSVDGLDDELTMPGHWRGWTSWISRLDNGFRRSCRNGGQGTARQRRVTALEDECQRLRRIDRTLWTRIQVPAIYDHRQFVELVGRSLTEVIDSTDCRFGWTRRLRLIRRWVVGGCAMLWVVNWVLASFVFPVTRESARLVPAWSLWSYLLAGLALWMAWLAFCCHADLRRLRNVREQWGRKSDASDAKSTWVKEDPGRIHGESRRGLKSFIKRARGRFWSWIAITLVALSGAVWVGWMSFGRGKPALQN
ncbi:MAG: hypothetical protein LBK42_10135 [Propionibacteriaceae bacterium]|jgi:hypothetical protein|nr:hypothetical protein [Propionibacteriaceae bacterium]